MLIKQTNDAGEEVEVEVYTGDELTAKLAEKDTEWQGKLQEKETAMTTLATEKAELETKLGETKEDNPNFKILKDALAKKDTEIKEIKDNYASDKKKANDEAIDLKIKSVTKGDPELEKKIRLNLTSVLSGMPEDTAENRQKKIDAAVKLSVDLGGGGPGMFDGGVGGGGPGAGGHHEGAEKVEFTPREKALGKKLGLSDEDYKKYGPKVSKRN